MLAALAPDAEWTEAEGFPYAGTYVGVEAILAGVSRRLGTEWIGYRAEVHTFLEDGDRIAASGSTPALIRRPADPCVFSTQYKAGQSVDIVYLPANPRIAILGPREAGVTSAQEGVGIAVGALFALIGAGWLFAAFRGRNTHTQSI